MREERTMLFVTRQGQIVLLVKMLIVLLHSPSDVAALAVADDVAVHPLPVGDLSLFLVRVSDVLHQVELPLVFLFTNCALEYCSNMRPKMDLQVPEDRRLEITFRTIKGGFP